MHSLCARCTQTSLLEKGDVKKKKKIEKSKVKKEEKKRRKNIRI